MAVAAPLPVGEVFLLLQAQTSQLTTIALGSGMHKMLLLHPMVTPTQIVLPTRIVIVKVLRLATERTVGLPLTVADRAQDHRVLLILVEAVLVEVVVAVEAVLVVAVDHPVLDHHAEITK